MPRVARLLAPAIVHHVIARFVNGEFLITDDDERGAYLRLVGRAITSTTWQLLAYAIMSSHIHLALWAGAEPLAAWIQGAHSTFAGWLQRRRRQQGSRAKGPVFAERPTTVLVDTERVAYLIAYLHNNPVRAGVVHSAEQSDWTSHRAYLGLTQPPEFLNVERGLEMAGFGAHLSGRSAFDSLVRSHAGLDRDPELSASGAGRVAVLTHETLGSSVELATPLLGDSERFTLVRRPDSVAARFDGSAAEVVEVVARMSGVSVANMRERRRCRIVSEARTLSVLAWVRLGRRPSEIASALGLSPSAISKAMSRSTASERSERLVSAILAQLIA